MIKIQNLKKVYKDCVALDTVSMHIRKGEFVAIIGASGSGKTTMLNIIGGLDTDYMGSCVVRNKEMSSLSDVECCTLRSRYISYVAKIIYVFLTIFLYLLKCPQSLILSALRAFCFCGKPHISRSIFLYFLYQTWLKSW